MKLLRDALVLLALAALPAGLAVALHPELLDRERAGLEPDAVRPTEASAWGTSVLWIDARNLEAHAQAHIPGAIPFDDGAFSESLAGLVAAWTPDRRIVIYCDSSACSRAREVAARLREAGFTEVYYLHGGWEAWNAAQNQH